MKRLITTTCFFFAFVLSFGLFGCDDVTKVELDGIESLTQGKNSFPEFIPLEGTSWILVNPSDEIEMTITSSAGETTTNTISYIPLSTTTSTLTVNANGTFEATLDKIFNANMANPYIDGGSTSYNIEHNSNISGGAFIDYENEYCDGLSNVTITGIWKKERVTDSDQGEGEYDTWRYQFKMLHSNMQSSDLDSDDTLPDANLFLIPAALIVEAHYTDLLALGNGITINDVTYFDEDTDWEISVSTSTDGISEGYQEVSFTFSNSLSSIPNGIYTRQ